MSDYKAATRPYSGHDSIISRDSVDTEKFSNLTLCSWLPRSVCLRLHVLIKYFSRRNHRHERTPKTQMVWGSVRISIPTLIIDYIYQWTATCAWTCSLYMSSVMLMETLLSPCIQIRTCPQREQKNFMTGFGSQVSLSSKMIWLRCS